MSRSCLRPQQQVRQRYNWFQETTGSPLSLLGQAKSSGALGNATFSDHGISAILFHDPSLWSADRYPESRFSFGSASPSCMVTWFFLMKTHSSIHHDELSGHVVAVIAGQKDCCSGEIFRMFFSLEAPHL